MKTRRTLRCVLLLIAALVPARASAQTDVIEYYGVDALGSVRVVFDSAGNLINRMDYGPFGEQLAGSTFSRRVYAQLFRDGETGQDYAEARMYEVRTGRFAAPDPVFGSTADPQQWNRYAYALNSPLIFTDPTGLLANQCDGRITPPDSLGGAFKVSTTCSEGGGGVYGGGGSGGISWEMYLFLSGVSFGQRGVGSGRVDEPGGGKGRTRGSTIPTTPTTPVTPAVPATPTTTPTSHPTTTDEPPEDACTTSGWPRLFGDYYTASINVGSGWFGGTVTASMDRFGNVFAGFGGNVGKSATAVSGNLSVGWHLSTINDVFTPTTGRNFLGGYAVNASGGFMSGNGVTYSPGGGVGTEVGFYWPQIGAAATRSWRMGNIIPGNVCK